MTSLGTVWWPVRGARSWSSAKPATAWSLKTLGNLSTSSGPHRRCTGCLDPNLWLLAEIRDVIGGDRSSSGYEVPADDDCSAGLSLARLCNLFDAAE
jgi:hypothetical protein